MRPDVDIIDPAFHVGDPHPAYRWMRENEPFYADRNGFVCVSRYDHLRDVERRSDEFVNSQGYRSIWTPEEVSMLVKDDPEHGAQRKLVSDMFTPKAVSKQEPWVREIVQLCLDQAGLGITDRFEVIDTLAAKVPGLFGCRLIGWPDSHWRDVRSWSERLMRIDTFATNPGQFSDAIRAIGEMAALTMETVPARRGCPADDLLSRWANAELDGCPLSEEHITSELGVIVPGSADTTRTTIARSLIFFSERNDLWEALAEDPSRIPRAVEELIRWITPLNNMFRTAVVDTEINGFPVATGARLALLYPSANRDEAVFERPDEVLIDRDPNPHVSFGFGTHFCLGAHFARLTVRLVLEELTARITNLRPASEPEYDAIVFSKSVEKFELGYDLR